jgi:hypothetical protein
MIAYIPLIRHQLHRNRWVQKFFYCCVRIFCRDNAFTEPLPSKVVGIHIQTHRLMGEFMKYAVEMGSCAVIRIPNFVKFGSGIQDFVLRYIDTETNRRQGDLKRFLYFFQNKESRLKTFHRAKNSKQNTTALSMIFF